MTYWEQRAVTEKLIAKRKSLKRKWSPEALLCGKPVSELTAQEFINYSYSGGTILDTMSGSLQ